MMYEFYIRRRIKTLTSQIFLLCMLVSFVRTAEAVMFSEGSDSAPVKTQQSSEQITE